MNNICGGSSHNTEECPGCGAEFNCYRGGSWDWKKKYCDACTKHKMELKLEELNLPKISLDNKDKK